MNFLLDLQRMFSSEHATDRGARGLSNLSLWACHSNASWALC
jgi:hypothetical protein